MIWKKVDNEREMEKKQWEGIKKKKKDYLNDAVHLNLWIGLYAKNLN